MSEICVVTTWQRDELLYLCLEAIRREHSSIPVYVFSDRGHVSSDLIFATDHFETVRIVRERHHRYGNSWNLLDALCWATNNTEAEIIHIVEDDTILHAGYFDWAMTALRTPPIPAAVCGRICSPNISNWYESPCASWNANHLRIALSHLVPEYLEAANRLEMQRVMDTTMFPNSRYRKGGAEQDGYFLRCIENHKWATRFPLKPLASHIGFYGYNRPKDSHGPTGSFEERIAFCRALLKDKERRVKLFGKQITCAEMEGKWLG